MDLEAFACACVHAAASSKELHYNWAAGSCTCTAASLLSPPISWLQHGQGDKRWGEEAAVSSQLSAGQSWHNSPPAGNCATVVGLGAGEVVAAVQAQFLAVWLQQRQGKAPLTVDVPVKTPGPCRTTARLFWPVAC